MKEERGECTPKRKARYRKVRLKKKKKIPGENEEEILGFRIPSDRKPPKASWRMIKSKLN